MIRRALVFASCLAVFILLLVGTNYIKAAGQWYVVSDNKISHRFVKKIKIDGNLIYVGTANKFNIYNIKEDKNQVIQNLPDNYITAIAYDDQNIWVGTPNGLAQINKQSLHVTVYNRTNTKDLPDNYITDVLVDGSQVWVATKRWGVMLFDPSTRKWKNYSILQGLAGNNVNCLALDGQYIWAGTDDGLSEYDKSIDFWKSYTPQEGLADKKVSSIVVDGEYIWAATMGGGLSRLNKLDDTFFNYTTTQGLVDDNIQCLTLDGRILWAGTFAGVSKFDKEAGKWLVYTAHDGLPEDSVADIAISGNYIWFATDGGGIARFDKVLPEAYLSPMTHYIKKGLIQIIGTSYSYQDIAQYTIEYRSEIQNQWAKAGIALGTSTKVLSESLGTFDCSELINMVYYLRLTVKDKSGNVNSSMLPVIVDTISPQLTLDELPDAVKTPDLNISGKYNEMNLIRISIKLNKDLRGADINRAARTFSADVTLSPGANNIEIAAEDIAGQKTSISRRIVFDNDKPELTVPKLPDHALSPKLVVSGTVKDYSLKRIVVNPGNIDVSFNPVTNANYLWSFSTTIQLNDGDNNVTVDAYDEVGNKSTFSKTVVFAGGFPSCTLDKTNVKVFKSEYVVHGTWADNNVKMIMISNSRSKTAVKADIDTKNGTFQANLKLLEGDNTITATISDLDNQMSFDILPVFYSTELSKFSINDYDKFSRESKVLITGKFKEPNLKDITLQPDNLRAAVDMTSNTFQIYIPLKQEENNYTLVLQDKMGTKTVRPVKIVYESQQPQIKMDPLPPVVNASHVVLSGSYVEKYPGSLIVNPGGAVGILNTSAKTFTVKVPLTPGVNDLTVAFNNLARNTAEEKVQVKYIPQMTANITVQSQATAQNVTVDAAVLAQLDELRKEVENLRAQKSVYVPVPSGPVDRSVPIPREKAVYFVPFDQKEGDTLYGVASQYLGSASYVSLITALNDILDYSVIMKRKSLMLPSRSMVKYLNQFSIFDSQVQIINAIAMAYNSVGSGGKVSDYYSKLTEILTQGQIQTKEYTALGSKSIVAGDVLIVLTKQDVSRDSYLKLKTQYRQIIIGRMRSASVTFDVL